MNLGDFKETCMYFIEEIIEAHKQKTRSSEQDNEADSIKLVSASSSPARNFVLDADKLPHRVLDASRCFDW